MSVISNEKLNDIIKLNSEYAAEIMEQAERIKELEQIERTHNAWFHKIIDGTHVLVKKE